MWCELPNVPDDCKNLSVMSLIRSDRATETQPLQHATILSRARDDGSSVKTHTWGSSQVKRFLKYLFLGVTN